MENMPRDTCDEKTSRCRSKMGAHHVPPGQSAGKGCGALRSIAFMRVHRINEDKYEAQYEEPLSFVLLHEVFGHTCTYKLIKCRIRVH
jgi:hypothetical protein